MKYSALILDMDGTLIHNMPTHNQAWYDTLAEAGVRIDMDEFNHTTTGKKAGEILRMILGTQLTDLEIEYWSERKESLYRERFASSREPLPGLLELLDEATALGLPMAVATAAPPTNISFIIDELDLRRYFKILVGGDDIQHGKPNPEIFFKAAEGLGIEPVSCLVFEDALEWGRSCASRWHGCRYDLHHYKCAGSCGNASCAACRARFYSSQFANPTGSIC